MARERLNDRLSASTGKLVTVVSAPAGAGKTCAVASWARARQPPGRLAWMTLEEGDDRAGVFWSYVVESLRYHGIPLDENLKVPPRSESVDRRFLAGLAASLAKLREPVVLVLDQIEWAAGADVPAGLDFVLRNAVPVLRLVITTRADPVLPLHRLRMNGDLAEIGQEELAFDDAETVALFHKHPGSGAAGLSPVAVSALLAKTEGWVGGLRLYALALQHVEDPDRFVRKAGADVDIVAEYLRAEVLDTLPPPAQDLLRRVSVLDRVHPDLADALTGRHDAAGILSELARNNGFIERIEQAGPWYRFHPMFAAALHDQLAVCQPGIEPELHRRAADWLARAGCVASCVRHAAAVDDWDVAATCLVERLEIDRLFEGLFSDLDGDRLDRSFSLMRPGRHTAATATVSAALAARARDPAGCLDRLEVADDLVGRLPPPRQPAYRLSTALVRLVASRILGDVEAARAATAAADSAVSDLPAGRLARRRHLLALMPCHLGAAQLWAGQHDDAARTLERAASAAVAARSERTRHDVLGQLALLNLARGRLRQARAQAAEAADIAAEARISVLSGRDASHAALARVALEQNDLRTVRRYLEDADRHEGGDESDQQQDPLVLVEFALLRSRVDRARRDRRAALDAIGYAAEWSRRHGDPRWVAERLLGEEVKVHLANRDVAAAEACLARMAGGAERPLAEARVHLADGRPDAALHSLESLEPEWDPDRSAGDGPIQAQLLRGHAALVLKKEALARQSVARAVNLARPEGYRRTFVEAGTWVRQMFWRFPDFTEARRWLAGEDSGTPPENPRPLPSALVVERLTQRELQVLTLLGQGLSADEIGTELYVSVNTVKTHLKGIYRKLSASRRREALQRARQLKLI